MKIVLILIVSTCFIASVFCEDFCPTAFALSNFDAKKFMGVWNEVKRFDNQTNSSRDCVSVKLQQDSATAISLQENFVVSSLNKTKDQLNTTLAAADPSIGLWKVNRPDNTSTHFLIMDTDYLNYALVWSCEYMVNNQTTRKFCYICSTMLICSDNCELYDASCLLVEMAVALSRLLEP